MSDAPRTERGLDRLVNFTDAAAAIAITLLVLPLVDLAADERSMPLGQLVRENSGTFVSFGVTFVVIGRLWLAHHQLFERLRSYDSVVVWLDLLWLACIVVLPFAAQELSNLYGDDPWVYVLYVGTMTVSFVALALIALRAMQRPDLRSAPTGDSVVGLFALVVLLLVVLVLAVVFPAVGMWWLLLLIPGERIEGAIARRRLRA